MKKKPMQTGDMDCDPGTLARPHFCQLNTNWKKLLTSKVVKIGTKLSNLFVWHNLWQTNSRVTDRLIFSNHK